MRLKDKVAVITGAGSGMGKAMAKLFAAEGFDSLVIDVSSEPQKSARALATNMQATYLPMPRASASDIARPVSMALKSASV